MFEHRRMRPNDYTKKIFDSADTPRQDLIFLDGANPRQRFKRFYLRSDGGLPDGLHYHLPGGGNLRGFYNQPIIGDEIFAINVEARKQLKPKLPWQALNSILGRISIAGFTDIAAFGLINFTEDIFADAGFGIRLQTRLPDDWYTIFTAGRNLTVRLDFPIWVSKLLTVVGPGSWRILPSGICKNSTRVELLKATPAQPLF